MTPRPRFISIRRRTFCRWANHVDTPPTPPFNYEQWVRDNPPLYQRKPRPLPEYTPLRCDEDWGME